jgi:DivIVA domain-containing protein
MPVLPEEITPASLRRRWRGYDRGQVEALLRRVRADYGGAIERIAAASDDHVRVRIERDDLRARLEALTEAARRDAERIRADADADATAIRQRAEQASALITRQAEEAGAARLRQVEALCADAQADAQAARSRSEAAERRARELEDAAQDQWDALRADTEARIKQLQLAQLRADRVRHAETALSDLRSQVALLDQVHRAETVLATLRAETYPDWTSTSDGEHHNGHQRSDP